VDIASLMYAASNTDVVMAADGTGIFIFPEFQPVADAMMAMVKLLEYLARHRLHLSEVVAGLPTFEVHATTVPCSWESKGTVMRRLQQEFAEFDVQVVDGIKVFLNEWEWVLARPDPDRPLFHIAAEAQTAARSEDILEEYARLVERLAQNRLYDT
jgi:mannose-1-phosphate guanylyltransferase/phosphomannomutase